MAGCDDEVIQPYFEIKRLGRIIFESKCFEASNNIPLPATKHISIVHYAACDDSEDCGNGNNALCGQLTKQIGMYNNYTRDVNLRKALIKFFYSNSVLLTTTAINAKGNYLFRMMSYLTPTL